MSGANVDKSRSSRRRAKRALARQISARLPFTLFTVGDDVCVELEQPKRTVWIKRHQVRRLRSVLEAVDLQPIEEEAPSPSAPELLVNCATGEVREHLPACPSGESR